MMRLITAAIAAFGLALSVHAQAPPGQYKIVPDHTRVAFAVSRFGLTTYRGQFIGAFGTLALNPANLSECHLDVSVPVAGISGSSRRFDAELEGPAWFDAARFPVMTFRSTSVTPTGPATANVAGQLTLHGVTRSVTLKAKFTVSGVNPANRADTAGFEARGRIRRSDFGVARYAFLFGDNVDLIISAAFERARS